MKFTKHTIAVAALFVILFSGTLHPQTDGDKAGDVNQVDKKSREIIVRTSGDSNNIQMGDLLYVRIDGKIVKLRATFPMQTITRCKAEGENRQMWIKIEKGMPVYRYKKSVEEAVTDKKETPARDRTGKGYKIGDRGPGGGWIFYDKGNSSNGWRYLEAAIDDQAMDAMWYNGEMILTGASDTAVGTGKSNTEKIIKAQGKGHYAARLCADYRGGGKSDWFLPSKDELDLMYVNLKKSGLVDFSGRFCWSSSEEDKKNAYFQAFMFGYTNSTVKTDAGRVRAVRAF